MSFIRLPNGQQNEVREMEDCRNRSEQKKRRKVKIWDVADAISNNIDYPHKLFHFGIKALKIFFCEAGPLNYTIVIFNQNFIEI